MILDISITHSLKILQYEATGVTVYGYVSILSIILEGFRVHGRLIY